MLWMLRELKYCLNCIAPAIVACVHVRKRCQQLPGSRELQETLFMAVEASEGTAGFAELE